MDTYTCTGKNDNVLGFAKESNSIVDGIVLGKLGSPREFAGDRDRQKRMVSLIWRTLEERGWRDSKRRA